MNIIVVAVIGMRLVYRAIMRACLFRLAGRNSLRSVRTTLQSVFTKRRTNLKVVSYALSDLSEEVVEGHNLPLMTRRASGPSRNRLVERGDVSLWSANCVCFDKVGHNRRTGKESVVSAVANPTPSSRRL